MTPVCRLCLSSSAKQYKTITTIREKFQLILPEIDIHLVQSPMFCQNCIDLLQTTYSFKCKCIKTEKMLKLYALNCGGRKLLLSDLLQSNWLEQNQIQSANNDTEAACSKDVKSKCDNDSFGCDLDLPGDFQSCPEIEIKVNETEITFEGRQEFPLCGSFKSTCNGSSGDESNKTLNGIQDSKRPFRCEDCGNSFHKRKSLMDHIEMHYEQPHCFTCNKTFSNRFGLKQHLLNIHTIEMSEEHEQLYTMYLDKAKLDDCIQKHLKKYESVVDVKIEDCSDSDEEALKKHSIEEIVNEEHNSDQHKVDRRYKCSICEKGYNKKQYLLDHIRIHFTRSNCNLCGIRFYNVGVSKRHLLVVHQIDTNDDVRWRDLITVLVDVPEMEEALKQHSKLYEMDNNENKSNCNKDQLDRPYKCNICKKTYHETKILQNHIQLHFTKTHCKLCGKEFLNVAALKCHLPTVHQIDVTNDDTWRDHIAVIVDVPEMEQALKEHEKLGEMDDGNVSDSYEDQFDNSSIAPVSHNYTCETCGKQFRAKSSLNRHKLIHGVKKSAICDYCQKRFVTKERLEMHISACHPNLMCDTCGYTTTRKNNFMDHIRIHTGVKPYTCNLCNKSFVQSSSLGTHMRTVHSTERLFTCEYCSKSFKIKGPLTKHILEVHLNDKIEKKFICNYCGKKYRLQCSLNSHLKWHKSDRPFSCDICKKTFVNNPALRKHKITHLAEKEHKCDICGKGFHYKYNIKIHMKVHGIQ